MAHWDLISKTWQQVHPWSLTWNPKISPWERRFRTWKPSCSGSLGVTGVTMDRKGWATSLCPGFRDPEFFTSHWLQTVSLHHSSYYINTESPIYVSFLCVFSFSGKDGGMIISIFLGGSSLPGNHDVVVKAAHSDIGKTICFEAGVDSSILTLVKLFLSGGNLFQIDIIFCR